MLYTQALPRVHVCLGAHSPPFFMANSPGGAADALLGLGSMRRARRPQEGQVDPREATQETEPAATPPPATAEQQGEPTLTARQQSARDIVPGCAEAIWDVKHWKGEAEAKPGKADLKEEVSRRDPEAKPNNYDIPMLVNWLRKHPPPMDREGQTPPSAEGETAHAPPSANTGRKRKKKSSKEKKASDGGGSRWKANVQLIRVLHAIVQHKEAFLLRNARPASRNALEAASRKSVWILVARACNNPEFEPPMVVSDDAVQDIEYEEHLSNAYDPGYDYKPEKCETEFKKFSSRFRDVMALFRRSGMGDCPEEEKVRQSNTTYSAKFFSFCQFGGVRQPSLAYAYELLLKRQEGLLESVQSEMPEGAQFSSDGAGSSVARPHRSDGGASWKKDLVHTMGGKVAMAKTADEKREDYESARLTKLKRMREEQQLAKELEAELDKTVELIDKYATDSVPRHLILKKKKLEKQLEDIYGTEEVDVQFTDDVQVAAADTSSQSRAKARATRARSNHDEDGDEEDGDGDGDADYEYDFEQELGHGRGRDHGDIEEDDDDDDEDDEDDDDDYD